MPRVTWILTCITVALATVCKADTLTATCTMTGVSAVSTEKISGTVQFFQNVSDTVTINVELTHFDGTDNRTLHGFHIHETGSTGNDCADAGSHFNGVTPGSSTHGAPGDSNRHVGDLGNVEELDGVVSAILTDAVISLNATSNNYIIGRAVVIHQDVDDLGAGGHPDSNTTGNAGARIGCCVIEVGSGTQGLTFSFTILTLCIVVLNLFKGDKSI